ncbi:hypothetical protein QYE76_059718 [Lolium multiflorum]|uniref:Uncharacterized protein n=1 Tax=Lolium multiflorum TaxID=4521 RepID=A0AAD8W3K6_LOLMU|nr:hypothetical protein QYE76_059718 [Lolium multiflorum]
MNRPFVNLVVSKLSGRRPVLNLHRIDPAGLFHPAAAAAGSAVPARGRMPPAAVSFDWPCPGWMSFMAIKNDVIATDHEGRTLFYDGALRAIRAMSPITYPMPSSISFTVGDELYVLGREPGRSRQLQPFQRLRLKDWRWSRSEPLPTVNIDRSDPTYFPYKLGVEEAYDPYALAAHTVVDDSHIWVSTLGAGTYSFDTDGGRWSKIGCWALPFRGRAEYVPERGLWFGFSAQDEHLCAVDLQQERPVLPNRVFPLLHVWEGQPPPPPEGQWTLTASHLLPLGSGKLCVSKLFRRTEGQPSSEHTHHKKADSLVVLAGVEIIKDPAGTGSLHIIRHKSVRYNVSGNVKPL